MQWKIFSSSHCIKVEEKSNEITVIPKMLDLLSIENQTIIIDAMGIQTTIAEKIIEKGGNYILAVKENQKQLLEQIKDVFRFGKVVDTAENIDIRHGRIET